MPFALPLSRKAVARARVILCRNSWPCQTYRHRLFAIDQSMAPSGHELTSFDPSELDGAAIISFERQLAFYVLPARDRPSAEGGVAMAGRASRDDWAGGGGSAPARRQGDRARKAAHVSTMVGL